MANLVPRRDHFERPERLSPAFTLTKGRARATCEVWSHEFGFELRLQLAGEDLPRTHVCRSHEELITVEAEWRTMLEAHGWTRAAG